MAEQQDPMAMLKSLEETMGKFSMPTAGEGGYTTEQLDQMALQLRQQVDELKTQADEIQKRTGMSRDQLEQYTNNPDNFSKEEWESITRIRDSIDRFKRQLWTTARTGTEPAPSITAKPPKGKGRRDHWIPS